jgi:hypothetical protein
MPHLLQSSFATIVHNVLQLAEGGDFQHKPSYEALKFTYPQNCPTKHETATFGKVLLAVRCFFFCLCPLSSSTIVQEKNCLPVLSH